MPILRFTSAALDDFADIAAHIALASGSRRIAVGFTDQLRQKCTKLAALPGLLGRARPELKPGIRSFAFKGYIILFRYDPDVFEVVNVLEGHRDIIAYYRDDKS